LRYNNINGDLVLGELSRVPLRNTVPQSPHGVFETILFQSGQINLKAYHFDRLFSALQLLNFDVDVSFTPSFLEQEVIRTVAKNNLLELCRIRLKVFTEHSKEPKPQYSIECFEISPDLIYFNTEGLKVGIASGITKTIDVRSPIKALGDKVYSSAMQQAIDNSWGDALVRNDISNIIESSIANVFWIIDDIIYTPPVSQGCIAGVMRRFLLEQLPAKGFICVEKELTDETLRRASEVFLTNAIRRIKWVARIEEHKYQKSLSSEIHSLLFP
jgi:branched-chain amino acid aminotransferase